MPRVRGKRVRVCACPQVEGTHDHAVTFVYLHARLYTCVGGARASHLCGMRCYIPSGMPQREAERELRERGGGGDLKRRNGRGQRQLFLNYLFLKMALPAYADDVTLFALFLFRRTLNNNNISSIPVSSFNHMPKLRTL